MLAAAPAPGAQAPARASFALIVGVNRSVDEDEAPLRYADDDAARYQDLFRLLGARTYLLTRLDENTRRLHPQAAAEARDPTWAEWQRAVQQLEHDLAQARAAGVETVLYVVYAGHGNVKNGQGYVSLEDRRLTGHALAEGLLQRVAATRVHLIVDACSSYFLAYGRGPGGHRRTLEGFSELTRLADDGRLGLLLSTSSARESHEWEGFQSGVFSHEVRSGLYGAADADGDGRVSYREIAAFVERANAAIANERFRPELHARPPPADGEGAAPLLELARALPHRIEVDGGEEAHLVLEDAQGVRLAELHSGAGQRTWLVRPAGRGPLWVRRVDDGTEYRIGDTPEVVHLAQLTAQPPRTASRGAAHEAFGRIFSLPYSRAEVERYAFPRPQGPAPVPERSRLRTWVGWSGVALSGVGLGAGALMTMRAQGVRREAQPGDSQATFAERNAQIGQLNRSAAWLYAAAGAAGLTGAALLLWPSKETRAVPVATGNTGGLLLQGRF
nr:MULTISPECIES: caspase family protein [Myxococcaceae]